MLYKHWKKIALTLTALFWASCSETNEEGVLYGCPPNGCYDEPESSDSNNDESSSSETSGVQSSSSEEKISSSSEASKPESSSSETSEAASSSSEMTEESSSSEFPDVPLYGVIGCVPMDSSVTYFSEDYSADIAKMWKTEEAKHAAVDKIDSIKQTLAETPKCLDDLRSELDRFVALYGAPTIIMNAVESCEDGTIQPSEEYANFLRMKAEWEANKPALEKELQKLYEDKLKEIEEQINKCLNGDV